MIKFATRFPDLEVLVALAQQLSWSHIIALLPPKAEFERKIREILVETRERLARRRLLPHNGVLRDIEYFYETKDDEGD